MRFPDGVTVRLDVIAALREGRHSGRRPGRLDPGRDPHGVEYCWTRERDRAYVVKKEGDTWVVLTTLTPTAAEAA